MNQMEIRRTGQQLGVFRKEHMLWGPGQQHTSTYILNSSNNARVEREGFHRIPVIQKAGTTHIPPMFLDCWEAGHAGPMVQLWLYQAMRWFISLRNWGLYDYMYIVNMYITCLDNLEYTWNYMNILYFIIVYHRMQSMIVYHSLSTIFSWS